MQRFYTDSTKGFNRYFLETRRFINSELADFTSNISGISLRSQIQYALLSNGKRLRPILVILSAQNVGADRQKVKSLALAFELLHTVTLIQDDIIDGETSRRGIPAFHEKWGLNSAILIGDALISLAINLISDFGVEIMKIAANTGLELCYGEYMDISLVFSEIAEERYFSQIRKKSASLFRAAAYCGALAGGGSRREALRLAKFGECLGIMYQIRDDIRDIVPSIPTDLKTGKVTLPLIHLYNTYSYAEKKRLKNDLQTLMNEDGGWEINERILGELKKAGSFTYCENKMIEYMRRGISYIQSLNDIQYTGYLTQMIRSLAPQSNNGRLSNFLYF